MMQIRGGGQGINDFVGESVGQELTQAAAELFPAQSPVFAQRVRRQELQACVARAPKPQNLKYNTLGRLLGDTNDAPDQTLLRTPHVQQRRITLPAHSELLSIQRGEPFAIFMQLCRPRGAHHGQSEFEFSSEIHARRL
jgi:hypothetical protein